MALCERRNLSTRGARKWRVLKNVLPCAIHAGFLEHSIVLGISNHGCCRVVRLGVKSIAKDEFGGWRLTSSTRLLLQVFCLRQPLCL